MGILSRCGYCMFLACCCVQFPAFAASFSWEELPQLPVAISGHAVGLVDNSLLVAGGSSFPVSPFQGGEKVFHSEVYVLHPNAKNWDEVAQLPQLRAYAGVASHSGGLYLLGGTDGQQVFSDSLLIRKLNGVYELVPDALPPLPTPVAFGNAAILGNVLYLIGGQESITASEALPGGWKIDLSLPDAIWQALPPLPAGGVILPVVCASGELYVISGARLHQDSDGNVLRKYTRNAWRLSANTWMSAADAPVAMTAAPSLRLGEQNFVLVFGGDDGALAPDIAELGDKHPGFSSAIWAYHPITDSWNKWGETPAAYVTTGAVLWSYDGTNSALVIPGGEDRPGHRVAKTIAATLDKRPNVLGTLDHAVLIGYFLILVAMGFYFSKREKTTDAFFLGGRRVPWWAVGISIFGTSLSAITYLSIPATAYAGNWVMLLANIGIVFVAPIVVLYYIPKFRQAPITTAYEFLELRFNLPIRIYGSLCFMAFQTVRVGIVLLLPAMALSAATGINVYYCILAMGVLATLYTVLGGIEAVIWTDVLQAIVLVFGAVFALCIIVLKVEGGAAGIYTMAMDADKFHTFNWTWDYTTTAVWVVLIGNCFANLYPYTADQTIVQRFLTTPDTKSAARAVWINAGLTIPITVLFFSIGTALWAYFKQHPEMLDPSLKPDATLPLFVVLNFPDGLKGLLIAAIFAASMSSLDSSINSFSSVITTDYYRRFSKNVTEKFALQLAKVVTVLAGAFGTGVAAWMASLNNTTLFQPFIAMLGLIGGGIAGIFALGVFTRRANGPGAFIGAVASASALYFTRQYTDVHEHLFGPIGFLTAFGVGYLASLPFGVQSNAISTNTSQQASE